MNTPCLGDPVGMRPSTRRYADGVVGVHPLADGREAHVVWLTVSQRHVDVRVWVPSEEGHVGPGPGDARLAENVVRVQAARVSEDLLQELES